MSIHNFCRGQIILARGEAKDKNIKIPPFRGSTLVGEQQWAIFLGDFYTEHGGCCAFNAREQAIYEFIDLYEGGEIDKDGNEIK